MLDQRSKRAGRRRPASPGEGPGTATAGTARGGRERLRGTAAPPAKAAARALLAATATFALAGCTHFAARQQKAASRLTEESRVLTTAVVDALNAQPTDRRDAWTETARVLATQDQRLEGLPARPLEVQPLIEEKALQLEQAGTNAPVVPGPATAALEDRFRQQDTLIARQRKVEEHLVAMGTQFEQERNARITRWTKFLGFGGLGVGGLVALLVFVPASIPLLGRLLGWVVGRLPGLAGAVGVVSTRAFDAVVRGVEQFKTAGTPNQPAANPAAPTGSVARATGLAAPAPGGLLDHLSRELDAGHKQLVRTRRAAQAERAIKG